MLTEVWHSLRERSRVGEMQVVLFWQSDESDFDTGAETDLGATSEADKPGVIVARCLRAGALESFEFIERARPVGFQEAGEAAIGENFSSGLAAGAVVGFVVGVANALDFFSTGHAGLSIAAVNGHLFSKCGDFFGEGGFGFGAEAFDPEGESVARGGEKRFPFIRFQLVCEGDGRKFCCVQNFVGVGVADSAEQARIGEGSLERTVFGGKCVAKRVEIAGEDFDSAGVDGIETVFACEDMQRGAMLCSGFGKHERTVGEFERGEISAG